MIIPVPVDINLLLVERRNYPWPKPDHCPGCDHKKLWGHGFVDALFEFSSKPVPLKRYRCPNCGIVVKLKPEGYFNRFQASIDTIKCSIESISTTGKILKNISRQRQHHWWVALKRKAVAVLGLGMDLKHAFEKLMAHDIIPVCRSI